MSAEARRALRVLFATPALAVAAAAQGENGFLRGEGKLDLAIEYHGDDYEEVISAGPGFRFTVEVERRTASLYAAYGATDDLDLVFEPLYSEARFVDLPGVDDEESDPQDLLLYAKWRVGRWDVPGGELSFLLEPGIKLPLSNYEDQGLLALGGGQTDVLGRVIAHYQDPGGGWYAALETGYDRRNGAPPDQLPLRLSAGLSLVGGRIWVTPFYDRFTSRGGSGVSGGDLTSSGADYDRVGVKGTWAVGERMGFTAAIRSTDDGRVTGSIPGFSFGIVLRM